MLHPCPECGHVALNRLCPRCEERHIKAEGKGKGLCPICGKRPKVKEGFYCRACLALVKASERPKLEKPFKYVRWRGLMIAIYPNGNGLLRVEASKVANPPKSKLIDLNHYCPGFTREQVKAMKSRILALQPKAKVVKVS